MAVAHPKTSTAESERARRESAPARRAYYQERLGAILRFLIEPRSRVLHIDCHFGDVLAAADPSYGVGVTSNPAEIEVGRDRHPRLRFELQDSECLDLNEYFDYVIISGLERTPDVQRVLVNIRKALTPRSRVVIPCDHRFRRFPASFGGAVAEGSSPSRRHLATSDIQHLLALSGYETVKQYSFGLLPVYLPGLSFILNQLIARLPGIRHLCCVKALVARPVARDAAGSYTISVIVPCKNERGNVEAAVRRIPQMGGHTEILFCDDKSTDGTPGEVRRLQRLYPDKDIKLLDGPGVCKALNVWTGFDAARGDILMILDGDLTTMPEELRYFYDALVEGKGDLINGSRMVYPMEPGAMPRFNVIGNKFFSLVFSYLLNQRIKDTLCGTKVLWRDDYHRIRKWRGSWGAQDRWGDFELLLGAAKLHLKVIDQPVRYLARTYGQSKMNGLANAWTMLRMCLSGLIKLKLLQK